MTKEEKIDKLLENYPDLVCNLVYERDIEYIKSILSLDIWQDVEYRKLLTTNIWYSNYYNVVNILDLPYWDDPKFNKLLTSNIWKRSFTDVKKTLEIEEWNDSRYLKLLTSNIWKSSYENIRNILEMEELVDPRYVHLLVPSIFNVCFDNIIPTIDLLDNYGISEYITNRCLRRDYRLTKILIDYMLSNNIPLIVLNDNNKCKLNRMLSDSNSYLKTVYGIDFKDLDREAKLVRKAN